MATDKTFGVVALDITKAENRANSGRHLGNVVRAYAYCPNTIAVQVRGDIKNKNGSKGAAYIIAAAKLDVATAREFAKSILAACDDVDTTPIKYMAYNHNNAPLMNAPASKAAAEKEAADYRYCTGNAAYVDVVLS